MKKIVRVLEKSCAFGELRSGNPEIHVIIVLGRIAVLRRCNLFCNVVCRSVRLSMIVSPAKWLNCNQDVVLDVDSKEPCIRWGPYSPMRMGNLEGVGHSIANYRDFLL